MREYHPVPSYSIKLELQNQDILQENVDEMETTNDISTLEDPTNLGIMQSLDSVVDFDQNLMNELDSDIMKIVSESQNYIMQHMDIREPLWRLKQLLEKRLDLDLTDYTFSLQGTQIVKKYLTRLILVVITIFNFS